MSSKDANLSWVPGLATTSTRGHELRDAMVPQGIIETNRAVDFVIVGGGLAGLTASHYLRGP